MNPAGSLGNLEPEGMKPIVDAMQKDQSVILRSNMEMSMKMAMAGVAASDTPIFKSANEVVGLSTEMLDDALFAVPGDCSAEPFEDVMKGITAAELELENAETTKAQEAAALANPKPAIPENVKAYIATLFPPDRNRAWSRPGRNRKQDAGNGGASGHSRAKGRRRAGRSAFRAGRVTKTRDRCGPALDVSSSHQRWRSGCSPIRRPRSISSQLFKRTSACRRV